MKGLQGERLRQSFRHFDTKETGYISPVDFQKIIMEFAQHKLSDIVLESLPTLCLLTPGGKISYSECIAFYNVNIVLPCLKNRILTLTRCRSFGRWIWSRRSFEKRAHGRRTGKSQSPISQSKHLARCDTSRSRRWRSRSSSITLVKGVVRDWD